MWQFFLIIVCFRAFFDKVKLEFADILEANKINMNNVPLTFQHLLQFPLRRTLEYQKLLSTVASLYPAVSRVSSLLSHFVILWIAKSRRTIFPLGFLIPLWYGHVLRKEDNDWVKKCIEYEVEGSRPRGRPWRTCREVVKEDCQAQKLKTEDAMDRSKWRKLIKDVWWSGWVWVGEFLLVPAYPGSRGPTAVVCVCSLSLYALFL